MKQSKEIKQNWTGPKNFDICKSFLEGRLSTRLGVWPILRISLYFLIS